MKQSIKLYLPLIILLGGAGIAWQIYANGPKVSRQPVEVMPPMVAIQQVLPESVQIPVNTQGTVTPKTSITLSAQVSGKVTTISENLANGGYFKKNDILLEIEKNDYQLKITKAEAIVAKANQQLSKAEVEYQQAKQDIQSFGKKTASVPAYALKKPQYEEAKANLKSAQADLEIARIQLQRCTLRAPFDGRVLSKTADIGQYITPGFVVAQLYSTDVAEIRLPITESQALLLNIASLYQQTHQGPPVIINGRYAGREYQWQGIIVRTEGDIDKRNRLIHVIAQVKNPKLPKTGQLKQPPLTMGMFVKAEIEGLTYNETYVLPRSALHGRDQIWTLDKDSRLQIQTVTVLHKGQDNIYISRGLQSGQQVIITPLDTIVSGMLLRVDKSKDQPKPSAGIDS